LIEMKSRGEKLEKHYDQTFEYWTHIVPHRPPFVILCNFDEFWIYDFNTQLFDPVDRIPLSELPENIASFNFLLPIWKKPIFGNNRVEVTRKAADQMATVFREIVERGEDRQRAQRFILQLLVSMVAEDIALLPREIVTELLFECAEKGGSSYDLIGGLFRQMAAAKILGEVSTLTKVFNQLRDHHRYIVYTVKNWNDFGCMIGYWLPHENPDEPVRVGIEIQSNPSSPVRKKVIEAFRGWSAGAGRDWKSDGLDDETAWSSIRKGKALQALMGEADQVRAIKNHLLALLKEVEAFRNKYPELPWGGMGESIAGKEDHDLSNDDPLPIELPPEAVPHLWT